MSDSITNLSFCNKIIILHLQRTQEHAWNDYATKLPDGSEELILKQIYTAVVLWRAIAKQNKLKQKRTVSVTVFSM